jgi:hypothetical protein
MSVKPRAFFSAEDVKRLQFVAVSPLEQALIRVLSTSALRVADVAQIRWSQYFRKHGCVRCERKKTQHRGTGFCAACFSRINRALKRVRA